MSVRQKVIRRLVLALLVSLLTWYVTAAPAHTSFSQTTSEKLQRCEIKGITGETSCGTYEVYENRELRAGRKIRLKVLVLRALTPTPKSDPLFVFAGGPGQGAVDGAVGYAQIFSGVRSNRDIVLVDQRGTGNSNPLNCELTDLNEIVQVLFGGSLPITKLQDCRRQLEQTADLRLYTTTIATDDIDDVRAWLGYEHINVYGSSYGSRTALVYLNRHPNHVRTVVVKAVAPQDAKNPLYNSRDSQRSLDRLLDDCAKDAGCAKSFPNLRVDLHKVFDGLSATPVKVTVPSSSGGEASEVVITRDVFAGALRRALMDANTQRAVPLMIQRALNGDFKNLGAYFGSFRSFANSFSLGMNLSVICAEDIPLITPQELQLETKGTFLGDKLVRHLTTLCKEWPRGEVPRAFYTQAPTDHPVLILSGRLDPDTPPDWGDRVAKRLPNSLHVVFEGASHLSPPKCTWEIIDDFISSGSTKNLELSCVAKSERPSFTLP